MAGSISLSLSQQFDELGKPLSGGLLYFVQAGTTATPQNAFKDTALTLPHPNPIELDSAGRIPAFYLADGQIKIRLTDRYGVTQIVADNLLVIGPSSGGGGGGGSVDPTTIAATGDLKASYGTSVLSGWVRANGRTIGSATSGAAERANSDCQALFIYLWGADSNLVVSSGRGASAAADWSANKMIALPDFRGRVIAGLDDMGASAAGRLTASYFGATATVLGASGGAESQTLALAQLPTGITSANTGAIALSVTTTSSQIINGDTSVQSGSGAHGGVTATSAASTGNIAIGNAAVTSNNTSGNAHNNVQPTMLATVYVKL